MASAGQEFKKFKVEDLKIIRHLGDGGFGTVSLAIDTTMQYEVAVKEVKLGVSVSPEMIMKEASKMLKVITCPYLVNIMGITENPKKKSVGIVMEFLEYGDLLNFNRKFMKDHDDDCMSRKIKMIHEIALGMNFLHNQKPPLIHRDLKLENVFVGKGFSVKIGDFGLAMGAQTMQSLQKKPKVGYAGTFTHIPPEGFASSKVIPDKFWDIFTFAITTFELTSGENPWLEHGDSALVSVWVGNGERPDLDKIPAKVPRVIVDLIEKCWAQKPTDRPQFQAVLKTIRSLSLSNPDLGKSDTAIMGRMSEEAGDGSTGTAARDSGNSSAWGSLEVMSISNRGQSMTGASKESGLGSQHTTSKEWKLLQEYGEVGDGDGQFRWAEDIAVCKNGDVIVTDYRPPTTRAYLFNSDGTYKFTFQSHPTNPNGKLLYPTCVTTTPSGEIIITDVSKLVKIFTASGEYVDSLSTVTAECNDTTKYDTWGVAASVCNERVIYVGDIKRQVVTVHDRDQQHPIKKLSVSIKPYFITCDTRSNIWVSDWSVKKVVRMSETGDELCIHTFRVDGKAGKPYGIICHGQCVYIAVMEVNEKNQSILGTGHIHQYSIDGQYQTCLITGMYLPCGIAMSNGKIYIANHKSVLVYG